MFLRSPGPAAAAAATAGASQEAWRRSHWACLRPTLTTALDERKEQRKNAANSKNLGSWDFA